MEGGWRGGLVVLCGLASGEGIDRYDGGFIGLVVIAKLASSS